MKLTTLILCVLFVTSCVTAKDEAKSKGTPTPSGVKDKRDAPLVASGSHLSISPSLELPKESYGAPQSTYGVPQSGYGASASAYGIPPESTYGPPQSSYGAPQSSYGAPAATYGPPQQNFGLPKPSNSYGPPKPVYGVPSYESASFSGGHSSGGFGGHSFGGSHGFGGGHSFGGGFGGGSSGFGGGHSSFGGGHGGGHFSSPSPSFNAPSVNLPSINLDSYLSKFKQPTPVYGAPSSSHGFGGFGSYSFGHNNGFGHNSGGSSFGHNAFASPIPSVSYGAPFKSLSPALSGSYGAPSFGSYAPSMSYASHAVDSPPSYAIGIKGLGHFSTSGASLQSLPAVKYGAPFKVSKPLSLSAGTGFGSGGYSGGSSGHGGYSGQGYSGQGYSGQGYSSGGSLHTSVSGGFKPSVYLGSSPEPASYYGAPSKTYLPTPVKEQYLPPTGSYLPSSSGSVSDSYGPPEYNTIDYSSNSH